MLHFLQISTFARKAGLSPIPHLPIDSPRWLTPLITNKKRRELGGAGHQQTIFVKVDVCTFKLLGHSGKHFNLLLCHIMTYLVCDLPSYILWCSQWCYHKPLLLSCSIWNKGKRRLNWSTFISNTKFQSSVQWLRTTNVALSKISGLNSQHSH